MHAAIGERPQAAPATGSPGRRGAIGIGVYLIALILIAAIPLCVIATVLIVRQADVQREAFERSLQETSRALSLAVDRQLVTYRVMLETLAEDDALRSGDMAAFHEMAARVAERHGAVFISLFDAAGRQVLNTMRPSGDRLPTPFLDGSAAGDERPPVGDSFSIRHVQETGEPYYSDLFWGLVAGRLIFTVNVPVKRDGATVYVLNAAFPPSVMTELLQENRQFANVPAVIFDRRGFIVGRWKDDERYAGRLVVARLREYLKHSDTGVKNGTTLEGLPLVYSYTRSPTTRWTASLGLDRARLESRVSNTWLVGGLLALGGLGLGAIAALILASRLRASMVRLSEAAVRNEPPQVEGLVTREIADVAQALTEASAARRAQAQERESRWVAEARKADAEEANRGKDHFIAVLSHELRNPLAPIRSCIDLLRRARMRGEQPPDNVVDILDRQSRHLARLVDDLLDVARIGSGKMKLHREPVDLVAVVRQAIESTMPRAEGREQRLVAQVPAQSVPVDGDFARLLQVVANLLDNAIKFTPPGGRIELALARVDDEAVLSISDTGRGIDPAFLPSLYTPFRQGEDTTHRVEGGLGLGLALARTLVELHGGSLCAHSDGVDRGSTFVVRLPCIADAQPREPTTGGLAVDSSR